MSRVAVFAHYDSDKIIREYVIYYLKQLKQVADRIIFVSDCDLSEQEISKITPIVDNVIAKHHGEYDFGSYKIGYKYLKSNNILDDSEELIFANDSCFGPLYPLIDVWKEMQSKESDFWGININNVDVQLHVQSFFVVFKKKVFLSEIFDKFMDDIKKEQNKDDIIKKYEMGLSATLLKNNYKLAYLFDVPIERNITGDLIFATKLNPLIKTVAIKGLYTNLLLKVLGYMFKRSDVKYPIELIKQYSVDLNYKKTLSKSLKMLRKLVFRLHFDKKKICILGRWYQW
jgi:hypothetical protein